MRRVVHGLFVFALALPLPARAQVALTPPALEPGAFERLALRVANAAPSPVVHVRLVVPDAVAVLGVDAPPGWTGRLIPVTDSTPQAVEWTGGELPTGGFREFAVFARLAADVRRADLVFLLQLTRLDGSTVSWRRGGEGAPLIVGVRGTTTVSTWGATALAGAAAGLAMLALVLALYRRRS